MNAIENLKSLILQVASRIVTEPEKLKLEVRELSFLTDIRIVPDDSDVGRIIGVGGCRWKAFNAICRAVGMKHGIRIELLHVREPMGDRTSYYPQFEAKEEWPKDDVLYTAEIMAQACFLEEHLVEVEAIDSEDVTTIVIHVAGSERHSVVRALERPFNDLLDAIGLMAGRKVRSSILADRVEQPDTADGRSTEAISRS